MKSSCPPKNCVGAAPGGRAAEAALAAADFPLVFYGRAAFGSLLRERYPSFAVVPARGRFRFRVSPLPAPAGTFRPRSRRAGRRLEMSRGDFHCSLDRRSGLGELSCGPGAQAADAFLRTLLSSLLNESGGALVHACGLAVDGKAHIFIGRSGAGKSTLARLASGAGVEVISDEIVPLRRERGRFFVYGSPFWGEMRPAGRPLKIPLAGIYALRKSRVNSLRPGPSAGFMPLFLRCCLNFSKEPAAASGLLDTAAAIRSLYKGEFHFSKKNASFLKLLK